MVVFLVVFLILIAVAFFGLVRVRRPNPFEEAMRYFHQKDFVQAIDFFHKTLQTEPFHPHAHFFLSKCYEHLNLPEDALKHLKEVRAIGIYDKDIQMMPLLQNIAEYQAKLSFHNDALETNLEILHIEPNDKLANNRLLLMALGEKRFDIAELYAEKVLFLDAENTKMMKAAAVAFYYSNKGDRSFEIIGRLMEQEPENPEWDLSFVSMCHNTHFEAGKEKIKSLLKKVEDNSHKRNLINFFLHICIKEEKLNDAVIFLEKRVSNPDYPDSLRERMYFFYILLLLKMSNFHKAEQAVEALFQFYPASSIARRLIPFVKAKNLTIFDEEKQVRENISADGEKENSKNEEPFVKKLDDVYEESIEDLFPMDFLYQNGHYYAGFNLNFEKYFSANDEGAATPRDIFSQKTESQNNMDVLEYYSGMNTAALLKFASRAVIELGFNDGGKELTPAEKDGVDIITTKAFEKGGLKYLISFRRFADNAKISDIYLSSYVTRVKSLRVHKAILFSNGSLTEGAKTKLAQENHLIEVREKNKLIQLLKSALL